MVEVIRRRKINVKAEKVWRIIGNFNGLPEFVPTVTKSTTIGFGAGAIRTIKVAGTDGATIERCEAFDPDGMSLSYSVLQSSLVMKNYFATTSVQATGADSCEVVWKCTFEPVGDDDGDKTAGFIGASYEGALRELNEILSS